jgi:hypothetical protein
MGAHSAHCDSPHESCAVVNVQAGATDITLKIRSLGYRDLARTEDVTDRIPAEKGTITDDYA